MATRSRWLRPLLVSVMLVGPLLTGVPPAARPLTPSTVLATTDTEPSDTPATSLYASNWEDLVGLAMASKLSQADTGPYGPRLGELRYSGDWTRNQIVDYSSFFRDETNSTLYDEMNDFETNQYYLPDGSIRQDYLDFDGSATPVDATRYYLAVPNQPFMVVRYHVENPTGSSITWNVLDQVHLNNPSRPSGSTSGSYDGSRNALFGDLTSVGGGVVVLGAFQTMDSHQVGDDTDLVAAHSDASPWAQFDASGSLGNNNSLTASDIDLGFQESLTIAASGSADVYFYISVRSNLTAAQSAADTALAQTGSYWFDQAASDWSDWLDVGERATTTDTGVNAAFDINLMTIKQMQNPTLGGIPATSNPISYQYGV